jgi:antitoxin StbD
MHTLFADSAISMSEFKKNPAAVLRAAGHKPVAVLNHNRPAFYLIEPSLMQAVLEALGDLELESLVRARLSDGATPVDVDIDDL